MADIRWAFWVTAKGDKEEDLVEFKSRLKYLMSTEIEKDDHGNNRYVSYDDDYNEIPTKFEEYEEDLFREFRRLKIEESDIVFFDEGTGFNVEDISINPKNLFYLLSMAYSEVIFLFQVQTNHDNGDGFEMYIYTEGELVKELIYSYEGGLSWGLVDIRRMESEAFKNQWLLDLDDDSNVDENARLSKLLVEASDFADLAEMVAEKCSDLPYSDGILNLSEDCNDDELKKILDALVSEIFANYETHGTYSPEKIIEIDLSGNNGISTLPESIGLFTSLVKLDIKNTTIEEIPASLLEREKAGELEITR